MQSPSSCVEELPRIAQLQDEIEKRDKELLRSKKENEALKVMSHKCDLNNIIW